MHQLLYFLSHFPTQIFIKTTNPCPHNVTATSTDRATSNYHTNSGYVPPGLLHISAISPALFCRVSSSVPPCLRIHSAVFLSPFCSVSGSVLQCLRLRSDTSLASFCRVFGTIPLCLRHHSAVLTNERPGN